MYPGKAVQVTSAISRSSIVREIKILKVCAAPGSLPPRLDADATARLLQLENANACEDLCSCKAFDVERHTPVFESQIRVVPSSEHVAMYLSSGENSIAVKCPWASILKASVRQVWAVTGGCNSQLGRQCWKAALTRLPWGANARADAYNCRGAKSAMKWNPRAKL
jgi:hypothetical protein